MVIAHIPNSDIKQVATVILSYSGKCILQSGKLYMPDDIANSILDKLSSKGISAIAIARCYSTSIASDTTSGKTPQFLLDCMNGQIYRDIFDMQASVKNSIQKIHNYKFSAFSKSVSPSIGFPFSRKIAAYTKIYKQELTGEFEETIFDSDILQHESTLTEISNTQSISNFMHHADENHYTEIPNFAPRLNIIYPNPYFGQMYWVDFGEPYGDEQCYVRPAIVIQASSSRWQPILVVPLTSKIKFGKYTAITPIVSWTEDNVTELSPKANRVIKQDSQLLFDKLRAVDKSRLRLKILVVKKDFLVQLVKSAFNELIFNNIYSLNNNHSTNNTAKKQTISTHVTNGENTSNTPERIPIKTTQLSDVQKKIVDITPYYAYEKLKENYSSENAALKITEFLKSAYGFKWNDACLTLLVKSILYTIHNNQDYTFNLNEFATKKQTKELTYNTIVSTISNGIKQQFFRYPKLKVSEFISLIAIMVGG